jgi:hypothetical protein
MNPRISTPGRDSMLVGQGCITPQMAVEHGARVIIEVGK